MKKYISLVLMCLSTSYVSAVRPIEVQDITNEIPLIDPMIHWEKIPDVAQYKQADWSKVIGRAVNISLYDAQKIADNDPHISYFFYVKGQCMVLENYETESPFIRVFHHGDAVFFSGTPHWGTSPNLADGYIKPKF